MHEQDCEERILYLDIDEDTWVETDPKLSIKFTYLLTYYVTNVAKIHPGMNFTGIDQPDTPNERNLVSIINICLRIFIYALYISSGCSSLISRKLQFGVKT